MIEIMTSWKEEGLAEGLLRGLREGRQEGQSGVVLRLLRRRFGAAMNPLEERIRRMTPPQLDDLAEALLDFADPLQVEAWLNAHQ